MIRPYPAFEPGREDPAVEARFSILQELVRAIRTIRSEFTIPPERKIDVIVTTEKGADTREVLESHAPLVAHLAGTAHLTFETTRPRGSGTIAAAGKGFEVFVAVGGAIDAPKEIARLSRDREKAQGEIKRTKEKLGNTAFADRAPRDVVDREKEKLVELARIIEKIDGYVRALGG